MARRSTAKAAGLAAAFVAAWSVTMAEQQALAEPSCGDGSPPVSRNVAAGFARLYRDWHRESERIGFSSNTADYVALPAYRGIVDLGPAVLPFLATKLALDQDSDFMLARAVVEICHWDSQAFAGPSEQAFRDKVLRKLNGG
jgi:hypothetical protein